MGLGCYFHIFGGPSYQYSSVYFFIARAIDSMVALYSPQVAAEFWEHHEVATNRADMETSMSGQTIRQVVVSHRPFYSTSLGLVSHTHNLL